MQKSLIALSEITHKGSSKHFHVSMALFDSRVGCHSGAEEIIHYILSRLVEQM